MATNALASWTHPAWDSLTPEQRRMYGGDETSYTTIRDFNIRNALPWVQQGLNTTIDPAIVAQLQAARRANPTGRLVGGESDAGVWYTGDPSWSVDGYSIGEDGSIGKSLKKETWGQDVTASYDDQGRLIGIGSGDSTALGLTKFVLGSVGGYYGVQGADALVNGAATAATSGGGLSGLDAAMLDMGAGATNVGAGTSAVTGGATAAGSALPTVAIGAGDLAPIAFEPITAQTLVGSGAWQPVAGAAAGAAAGTQAGGKAATTAGGTAAGGASGGASSAGGNMSWMDWAELGANVGSTLINSNASKDAAKAQTDAANQATQLQREMYQGAVERNKPWEHGGRKGFDELLMQLGLAGDPNDPMYGSLLKRPTAADVMADPGYQFGLEQGQNALNAQFNSRGMRNSGAQIKAAAKFGNNYGTTKYGDTYARMASTNQDIYNRLMGVSNIGQAAANNTTAQGNIFASQAGQNAMSAANANAANSLAQGSLWSNALNQGVSVYNNRQRTQDIWNPRYDDTGGQWGGWTGQH